MGAVSLVQILSQQGTTCCSRSWFLLVERCPEITSSLPHRNSLHDWRWFISLLLGGSMVWLHFETGLSETGILLQISKYISA